MISVEAGYMVEFMNGDGFIYAKSITKSDIFEGLMHVEAFHSWRTMDVPVSNIASVKVRWFVFFRWADIR